MFMTYLHTKYHTFSYNDSLVIVIKPKAKEIFTKCRLVFFKFYKNITMTKVTYFLSSNIIF
jgi:hypothetical protein